MTALSNYFKLLDGLPIKTRSGSPTNLWADPENHAKIAGDLPVHDASITDNRSIWYDEPNMMHRATLDDVAALAGVSIKTVSRVVNREPNVREATQQKVNEAIAELNYKPNPSARNLASQRSHLIALVYDDPSAYELPSAGYIINMQEGALRACKGANYDLLIHPCNYRDRHVGDELRSLIEHARPDGLILAAPLSNMPRIVDAIEETGTPLVKLSPGKGRDLRFSISTNDEEVSAEMTCYLASLGHRRIAFVTGHPSHKAVANRYSGYKGGLRKSGIHYSESLVVKGDNSLGSGERAAEKLLQGINPPTAIFAANDDMAVGVLRAAERLGISVPQQLSVAGFDDIALARQVHPALTTVSQPLVKMTERAAMMLIDGARSDREASELEVIPAQIKVRESTGKPHPDA